MKFLRHFQSPLLDIDFWISHVVGTMECLTLVMLCDSGSLDQSNHEEDNSKVPHRGKESKRHQVEILVEWEVWFRWSLCHIYIYFTFKLLSLVTTALYHRFLQLVCFGLFLCEDLLHYPCNDAHQWVGCLGACRHHSHLYMLPMPLTTFLTKRWNLQWLLVCKHYEKTV